MRCIEVTTRAEKLALLKAARSKGAAVKEKEEPRPAPVKLTPPKRVKAAPPIEDDDEEEADWSPGSFATLSREWRVRVDPYNHVVENYRDVLNRETGQAVKKWVLVGYCGSFRQVAECIARHTAKEAVREVETLKQLIAKIDGFADAIEIHLDEGNREMIRSVIEEAGGTVDEGAVEAANERIRDITKALPRRKRGGRAEDDEGEAEERPKARRTKAR